MVNFYFYKGLYKVKVLTKSEGYWIVEAQEDFEDHLDGKKVAVKTGEQRIVAPSELHQKKIPASPVPKHVYERQLEKKVNDSKRHQKNRCKNP
ncbi:MAG: hypothetical protein LBI79_00805 [Nitrososphaerota archaeon]|jgi:hypothetical protein|nr:hypothetical protein [Nitrososphaerota archaeon]